MSKGPIVPQKLTLGPCKNCGNEIVIAMQKGVPFGQYASEEFCSATCCREFHGVVIETQVKKR